jgi:hypothetical protein
MARLICSLVSILFVSSLFSGISRADPQSTSSGATVLANGDFHLADPNGHPVGWDMSPGADKVCKLTDEAGTPMLSMYCPVGTKKEFVAWRTIAVGPDWCWLRVSALVGSNGAPKFRAKYPTSGFLGGIRVKFMDRNGKPTGWASIPAPETDAPAAPVTQTFEVPDNTATANVECNLGWGITEVEVEVGQIEVTPLLAGDRAQVKQPISLAMALRLGDYAEADRLALGQILANPQDTGRVQWLQRIRAQGLLKQNKPAEALAAAKGVYGVCTMAETGNAIALVSDCLKAAYPDDPSKAKLFADEQTIDPTGDKAHGATVLSQVVIDSKPYDDAIATSLQESFPALTAKGNLLILAGKADEATAVMKQAAQIAPDKQMAAGLEGEARCMKAADGTFARANAFILSLRAGSNQGGGLQR